MPDHKAVPLGTRLTVLLFTDIVGSTDLKRPNKLGDSRYLDLLKRHNELFEAGLREIRGASFIKHTGDGYFATFTTASDAVRFALLFQSRMGLEPWGPVALTTRIGIHVGEISLVEQGRKHDVIGQSADLAARVMSLATGGQILLTAQAFNDARQYVREGPAVSDHTPPLRWLAHGPYQMKGLDTPIEIFEVGIEGFSPLARPLDSEKATRVARHEEESVLGWRPAPGIDVPSHPNWILREKIGEGGFGEVWLAEHAKLGEKHVFKFCFNVDRLRSLKREYTLFRLLKEALGDRPDIAKLIDYNLDQAPFYLESEYASGGNLLTWIDRSGGISSIPLPQRIQILIQVTEAVGAAHSVGVLHKDIKPSNVLIEQINGEVQPQLSDFGIGFLADPSTLRGLAITETGFTQFTDVAEAGASRTGTRMYAPPEALAGKPFTTQSDVYALGVMLYQLTVGDLNAPLAEGWRDDVHDELLRNDIASCVQRDSTRRPSAAELAQNLRQLDQRRDTLDRQRNAAHQSALRARREKLFKTAALLLLSAGVIASLAAWKYITDLRHERAEAVQSQQRAQAAVDFIVGDIFANITPARLPKPEARDLVVKNLIDPSLEPLNTRFSADPLTRAQIESAVAKILTSLERYTDAEPLYRDAMESRRQLLGPAHHDTLISLFNYAYTIGFLHQNAKALDFSKQAMDGFTQILGPDNPQTLDAIDLYADLLLTEGKPALAEPLRKSVLNHYRQLAPDSSDTLLAENNYANVLLALGQLEDTEKLYRHVLIQRRLQDGDNEPTTIGSMEHLARVLILQKRSGEAEPLIRESVQRARDSGRLGPNARQTKAAEDLFLKCLLQNGEFDEAQTRAKEYDLPAPTKN